MTEPGLQICLKTAKKYLTFGSFFSMLTISESLSVIGVTMLTIAISLVNSIFELALSNRKYTFTQKGTFETIKNSLSRNSVYSSRNGSGWGFSGGGGGGRRRWRRRWTLNLK